MLMLMSMSMFMFMFLDIPVRNVDIRLVTFDCQYDREALLEASQRICKHEKHRLILRSTLSLSFTPRSSGTHILLLIVSNI